MVPTGSQHSSGHESGVSSSGSDIGSPTPSSQERMGRNSPRMGGTYMVSQPSGAGGSPLTNHSTVINVPPGAPVFVSNGHRVNLHFQTPGSYRVDFGLQVQGQWGNHNPTARMVYNNAIPNGHMQSPQPRGDSPRPMSSGRRY